MSRNGFISVGLALAIGGFLAVFADDAVSARRAETAPPPPVERILVNLGERRLYALRSDGETEIFPVAIGAPETPTPTGITRIARKRTDPTWVPTAEMRARNPGLPRQVAPGPDNPLGHHALDLEWPTYVIHGTNEPQSIGGAVTNGCIRLADDAIERLYQIAPVGTVVEIVDEEESFDHISPAAGGGEAVDPGPLLPTVAPRPFQSAAAFPTVVPPGGGFTGVPIIGMPPTTGGGGGRRLASLPRGGSGLPPGGDPPGQEPPTTLLPPGPHTPPGRLPGEEPMPPPPPRHDDAVAVPAPPLALLLAGALLLALPLGRRFGAGSGD